MAHCSIRTHHVWCWEFAGIGHCILLIISEDTNNYFNVVVCYGDDGHNHTEKLQ